MRDVRTPTKQAWMCCFWRYGWKNLQWKFLVFLISMQGFCLKSRKTQADTRVWCGTGAAGAGGVCWKNAGIEEYLVTDLKTRDFCKSMFVVYRLCHILFILPTVEYMCKAFYDGGDGGRWWWTVMVLLMMLMMMTTMTIHVWWGTLDHPRNICKKSITKHLVFLVLALISIMAGGWLVGWA